MKDNFKPVSVNFKNYILGIVIAIIPLIFLILNFNGSFSGQIADWGNWGQYVAGTVGTIISAITIFLILDSIKLQTQEFNNMIANQKETIDLLKTQNNENTFFNLVDLHHRIVENITLNVENKQYNGREAIFELVKKCNLAYYNNSLEEKSNVEVIILEYKEQFSHYLNNIYNSILIIKEMQKAYDFIKIYCSQFSNTELILLGYISVFSNVEFGKFIKEVKLLDAIDFERHNLPEGHKPLAIEPILKDLISTDK